MVDVVNEDLKLFFVQVYDPATGKPVTAEIPVMAHDLRHATVIVHEQRTGTYYGEDLD